MQPNTRLQSGALIRIIPGYEWHVSRHVWPRYWINDKKQTWTRIVEQLRASRNKKPTNHVRTAPIKSATALFLTGQRTHRHDGVMVSHEPKCQLSFSQRILGYGQKVPLTDISQRFTQGKWFFQDSICFCVNHSFSDPNEIETRRHIWLWVKSSYPGIPGYIPSNSWLINRNMV